MIPEIQEILPQSLGKDTLHILIREAFSLRREELKLKQLEVQRDILLNEIALKDRAVKISSHMKEVISGFVESEGADNSYAPMAISSISQGFSSLLHDGANSASEQPELDLSLYENPKKTKEKKVKELKPSGPPLEQRIKTAVEQGFRWNDHNIMPTNQSTVLRKIGEWEQGFEDGKSCNLANIFSQEYGLLLKEKGKAFLVGSCTSAENELGLTDPPSSYLKRRFNTLKDIYLEREKDRQIIDVDHVEVEEYPEVLEKLYRFIFKDKASENHWSAKKDHLLRLYNNRNQNIHEMDGATLGRLVDLGVCPDFVVWRNEEEKRRFLNLQPGMWLREQREYYSSQMEAVRDEFIQLNPGI